MKGPLGFAVSTPVISLALAFATLGFGCCPGGLALLPPVLDAGVSMLPTLLLFVLVVYAMPGLRIAFRDPGEAGFILPPRPFRFDDALYDVGGENGLIGVGADVAALPQRLFAGSKFAKFELMGC